MGIHRAQFALQQLTPHLAGKLNALTQQVGPHFGGEWIYIASLQTYIVAWRLSWHHQRTGGGRGVPCQHGRRVSWRGACRRPFCCDNTVAAARAPRNAPLSPDPRRVCRSAARDRGPDQGAHGRRLRGSAQLHGARTAAAGGKSDSDRSRGADGCMVGHILVGVVHF